MVLKEVESKPISVEVFSNDFPEMRRQALAAEKYEGSRLCQDAVATAALHSGWMRV
jgi:hypothetical protein